MIVYGDKIDAYVDASSVRPFIPQPDPAKLVLVDGVVGQKPLADVLELFAPYAVVGVEPVKEIGECPHARGC